MISINWNTEKPGEYVVSGGPDGPKVFDSFEAATEYFKMLVDDEAERLALDTHPKG